MDESTLDKNVQIHFDYLAFTIPLMDEKDVRYAFEEIKEDLANLFYMTSFNYGELSDWAQDGYAYQLTLGENIVVRFGGKRNSMRRIIDWDNRIKSEETYDSLNVEIKGQGCREIESLSGGTIDYLKVMDWIESHGGRFTRIDIAIDDMKGDIIKLSKILDCLGKGLYTSNFRGNPNLNGSVLKSNNYKAINVDEEACTIYFGSSSSDKRLCIYNKKAERLNNNDSWVGDYWIRFELRFRHDAADNLAYFISRSKMEDLGVFACEQLKRILELKCPYYNGEKSKCKNVAMLDVLPEWEDFLGVVKGTKFSLRPVLESTIESVAAWRTKSLTKQSILLQIADTYEDSDFTIGGLGRLYKEKQDQLNYLLENRDRITGKDLAKINNYCRSKHPGLYEELMQSDIDEFIETLKREIKALERFRLPF